MPIRNAAATIRVALVRAGLALAVLATGYVLAGLICGAVPGNAGWAPPQRGIRIFVASNGIHTDLILPKVAGGIDWRPLLRREHLRDPRYAGYRHAGFGWGDARFYLETPTWADVRPGTVVAAALGSERTLVHVDHLPQPAVGADVRAVMLRPAEYRRLVAFIRASFAERTAPQFGYGPNDAFYTARGRYSALTTCNAWTGDALRHAGVRVGAWTPFPATVMWWF
ncbi:MAG: TIGR02117 family protein [Pseudomonadota bacterium]